jgi:hypothetical protein
LLGLVALAGIAVGALAAAGVFSHSTTSSAAARTITAQSTPASTATSTSVPAHQRTSPPAAASNAAAANAGQGTTPCGGDLSVGPNTSCGFAANVEQAYDQTSGGPQTVTAFSPATGITYTINCTAGTPHVCTGGTTHNASVYFTSGASGAGAASTASVAVPAGTSTAGMHGCGGGVSGNGVTSCPFAQNVFQAYASGYQSNGGPVSSVTAYSPVTKQTYIMSCATNNVTVNCTGAKGALVTFPMSAVRNF